MWYKAGRASDGRPAQWVGRVVYDREVNPDQHLYYPHYPSLDGARLRTSSNGLRNIQDRWWVEDDELNMLRVAEGL